MLRVSGLRHLISCLQFIRLSDADVNQWHYTISMGRYPVGLKAGNVKLIRYQVDENEGLNNPVEIGNSFPMGLSKFERRYTPVSCQLITGGVLTPINTIKELGVD